MGNETLSSRRGEKEKEKRNEQYFNQPSKDLGDAAIANLQYPGDVAGPRARMRQLDDLLPGRVWKRSTADEHTPELIHATVTCVREIRRACEL